MAFACGHRVANSATRADQIEAGTCPACNLPLVTGTSTGGTHTFHRCDCCDSNWVVRADRSITYWFET